ncbi:MAG: CusA/CzcA family heavy metal efflux RND transporter [Fibrobacterota bacterium]|nr:CusA/CzcA family heavy metal efflux RND transporter [Fibrobacterota bacterium]
MPDSILDFSLKHRFLILACFALILGLGTHAMLKTPVDAFPDTTPIQVQINTVASALSPSEIEQQITMPVELSVSGLPGLANVRSISKFGLSQIVATFDDGTPIYDARQLILERISGVELPEGIERPQMGPIATGLGEVFHYTVRSNDPKRPLDEIRTLHDWVIKPEMRKVKGVADVNSWGGFELQYQVIVNPDVLVKYGLTLQDVFEALENNNSNVGGGEIITSGQSLLVHGKARVTNMTQIGNITVSAAKGVPIRIRDIAEVRKGHEIRRGAVTGQGKGEVVLGLCFMLMGENSKAVTEKLKVRLDEVKQYLPKDIQVDLVYDRTDLVKEVIETVRHNLIAGALLVILVLFLIMGNFRAGILVAATIPMAMFFAFLGMYQLSIAASLLSLGAMDFGILVDGSVVMTDMHIKGLAEMRKRLGRQLTKAERLQSILASSKEVLRPTLFGMGIVILVFVPILTLEGIEGKMFKPMAWTFIFAILGALIIAVTLTPILSYFFLSKDMKENQSRLVRFLDTRYVRILEWTLARRKALFFSLVLLLLLTGVLALQLGGVFIPRLSEGSLAINVIRLAGVSIEESVRSNTRLEALLLKEFPDEIDHVWSRIGTAEVATDPMGLELTDVFIKLKPRSSWTKARSQDGLTARIDSSVRDFPGANLVFTQPIEMRMNEMVSGIRSDVGIKIYGDDFGELVRLSDAVQKVLVGIHGSSDVSGEQITGQPTLEISVNQEQIARLGIPARNVLDIIASVGNYPVGDIVEGQRRFPLVVRLPDEQRSKVKALANTLVPTASGVTVPLRQVADIVETEGPSTINREWGRRLIKVQTNVRDRDVASFVKEARKRISEEVKMPEGYVVEWGGQFENLERAKLRLMIVVPVTLLLIFILLFMSLKSMQDVLIIYTGIPLAAIGGVLGLWLRGLPFSVSAAIGFIALSGIAVLNGQIIVSAIRNQIRDGSALGEAVRKGALSRLQPVLATAIVDVVGFIPMALSSGLGAEVQRPLATVVIGGMITSTFLTLLVLPALYVAVDSWKRR